MESIYIRPSEPCIFAFFRPTIFKFRILIEDYMRINETFGFFDLLPISSEKKLGLEPSQIKMFFQLYFITLLGFSRSLLSWDIFLEVQIIKKKKLEQKNKMEDKIKIAAKHEFSIAHSIFMEINWNLGFGKNVL
jgi:hypothetical protein